jgi:hypothetical protein
VEIGMKKVFLLFTVFVFIGCGMMGNPKDDNSPKREGDNSNDFKQAIEGSLGAVTFQDSLEFASTLLSDFYLINRVIDEYGEFDKKLIDENLSIVSFSSNYLFDKTILYANSTIEIDSDVFTLNTDGKYKGIDFYRKDVVYRVTQDELISFELISGLNNNFFKADESRKDDQIAFKIDQQGDLQRGGVFYYVADSNKSLTLQATNINEITVKFDLNSDKVYDINETKIVKLKAN